MAMNYINCIVQCFHDNAVIVAIHFNMLGIEGSNFISLQNNEILYKNEKSHI